MKEKDSEYFDLCVRLAAEIDNVHSNSRRYTKRTLWSLLFVPLVLLAVIFITGTSKITALFVWLAYMFLACGFLIFIEYTDHRLKARVTDIMGGDEKASMIKAEIEELRRKEAEEAEKLRLNQEAIEDADADEADELVAIGRKSKKSQKRKSRKDKKHKKVSDIKDENKENAVSAEDIADKQISDTTYDMEDAADKVISDDLVIDENVTADSSEYQAGPSLPAEAVQAEPLADTPIPSDPLTETVSLQDPALPLSHVPEDIHIPDQTPAEPATDKKEVTE